MKQTIGLILVILTLASTTMFAAKGTVVTTIRGCDYYVVSSPLGYAILEWYGGVVPTKGDTIVGDFESYGLKDVYDVTKDAETTVWVEDFFLSSGRAVEKILDKCD